MLRGSRRFRLVAFPFFCLVATGLSAGSSGTISKPGAGTAAAIPPRVSVSADDDPAIGSVAAPVTIIEFSDYQCPFCARADDTVKRVLENYKGKVRLVFRDFPSPQIHAYAMKAAEAAACANEQGKFWEYHDALYADQSKLAMVDLLATAGRLGLNDGTFQRCVESGKFSGEVSKDMEDGIKAGVNGTPSFFINGILIAGAQRYEKFAEVIDAELARGENPPKAPQK